MLVDQVHTNPSERHEMEEHWDTVRRRHRFLGIVGLLLVLAMIGLVWYAYPELRRHDALFAQLSGVQPVVDKLVDRAKEVDAKIESAASNQQDLRNQVAGIGERMETRIQALRRQVQETSAVLLHRVQAEVDNRLKGVETQLARLETASDRDETHVAQLQQQLTEVRREMAKQAGELNAVRRDMEQNGAIQDRRLAALNGREELDRRDVDTVALKLNPERVDFEITKNHSQELAPGISLGITGTDVLYRRVSGWMWVMPDRRTIWLRQQGAQQPVVFYGTKDGKRREIVITNVTKNSVSGYLLLPKDAA